MNRGLLPIRLTSVEHYGKMHFSLKIFMSKISIKYKLIPIEIPPICTYVPQNSPSKTPYKFWNLKFFILKNLHGTCIRLSSIHQTCNRYTPIIDINLSIHKLHKTVSLKHSPWPLWLM